MTTDWFEHVGAIAAIPYRIGLYGVVAIVEVIR